MITHDLRVANFFSDRIAVLYRGKLVEIGQRRTVVESPRHPYTRMLMDAAPSGAPGARRARSLVLGEIGDSAAAGGCVFRARCWLYARLGRPELCASREPPLRTLDGADAAACHFAEPGVVPADARLATPAASPALP